MKKILLGLSCCIFSMTVIAQNDADFKTYSKFDFVPGEKLMFFDDFTQDNAGDFPARWNTNGKGEVVTSNQYP